MNIKQIKINQLQHNLFDIKEDNSNVKKRLKHSLKKWGQIYPIIVYPQGEKWIVIKGQNVVDCLKELGVEEVYINEIDITEEAEILKFQKLVSDTHNDIDILKLSLAVNKLAISLDVNTLSEKLEIGVQQVINLTTMLKLDKLIKTAKTEIQPNLL